LNLFFYHFHIQQERINNLYVHSKKIFISKTPQNIHMYIGNYLKYTHNITLYIVSDISSRNYMAAWTGLDFSKKNLSLYLSFCSDSKKYLSWDFSKIPFLETNLGKTLKKYGFGWLYRDFFYISEYFWQMMVFLADDIFVSEIRGVSRLAPYKHKVISGYILTNVTPKHSELFIFWLFICSLCCYEWLIFRWFLIFRI
jgi:hypothetical protein